VLATGAVAATAFALHAAPSPAPVPPKDCGFIEVKGHRYNIKSDQLRCKRARKYSRHYLKGRGKPKGYSCTNYGSETAIKFRCSKGVRVFFAIRR
jgi:hypothetical protein